MVSNSQNWILYFKHFKFSIFSFLLISYFKNVKFQASFFSFSDPEFIKFDYINFQIILAAAQ